MVRVRFAPSPTGFLHIGGLRTALYNYLFARHNGGKFLIRIEDTDRTRIVSGAVEKLFEILKWCGLDYDEQPILQSSRLNIYKKYVNELLSNNFAYRCFCSADRLADMRKVQIANKQTSRYDGCCRKISEGESENLSLQNSFTVRMKMPADEIKFSDIIRGEVTFDGSLLDDQVILKSDGYPTYHLANVVDDHLMGITHVIRGEEWLSSTPKHIVLYRYFGWAPPQFAHLPLLLNPDKSKLSKRQGDVAVEDYREKGYLYEALLNYVALLGWSTDDSQQIFSKNELVEKFTLERCGKSGAIFDAQKLLWMNGEYIRKSAAEKLTRLSLPFLKKSGLIDNENLSDGQYRYVKTCITLEQEKVNLLSDFPKRIDFLIKDEYNLDDKIVEKILKTPDIVNLISELKEKINSLAVFNAKELENLFRVFAAEKNLKTSPIFHSIRAATSGRLEGPSLFHYLELLGKSRVVGRIEKFLKKLKLKC